jgi:hypothetical protein
MLVENKITPNASIPEEDKRIISNTIGYLSMMEYTKDLEYLKKDFRIYNDFYNTFGFYRYEENMFNQEAIYMSLNQQSPIMVSGYDALVVANFYFEKDIPNPDNKLCDFKKEGKTYTISKNSLLDSASIWISNDKGEELINVNMKDVFDKFDTPTSKDYQMIKESINADQATFTLENDKATISLVAINLNIEKSNAERPYNGDFYVLVKIK